MTSIKTKATARLCTCGCGTTLVRKTSNYAPGHDAKHVSLVVAGVATLAALPTKALQIKANSAIARQEAKPSKSAKATRRPSSTVEGTVKIGRWVYPARKLAGGKVVRNTKRDSSGEWVPISSSGRNSVGAETFRAV